MTDLVNSKPGKVPSTDGAPALPTLGGQIFGNSPCNRRPTSESPISKTRVPDKDLAGQSSE
jgi:hypothetical protein